MKHPEATRAMTPTTAPHGAVPAPPRSARGRPLLALAVVALTLTSALFVLTPLAGAQGVGRTAAPAHPSLARANLGHDLPIRIAPGQPNVVPLPAGLAVRPPAPLLARAGSSGLSPSPYGPRPALGSGNLYITDFGTETTLAPGANNQSFAAAVMSGVGFTNGSGEPASWPNIGAKFSGFFWSHGMSAAAFTTDGGNSWTENWLTLNSTWTSSCATHGTYCGDVNEGAGYVAGNGSGLVLLAEQYDQPCAFLLGPGYPAACNNTLNYSGTNGIAVARSANGGASWGSPAIINSAGPEFTYLDINWSASGCPASRLVTWLNGNFSFNPVVAVAPGGQSAVVTWTEESFNYAGDIGCNGGQYVLLAQPGNVVYQMVATTTDGGKTWGNVRAISDGNTAPGTVVVGPAPHFTEYLAESDYANQSGGAVSIDLSASTNNGSSWSSPTGIAAIGEFPVSGFTGGGVGYPGGPQMQLAVDSSPTSPNFGNLYLVWSDNRSSSGGMPSVAFSSSTDGGNAWSSAVYVTPDDSSVHNYMIPKIAVDPTGAIWVDFYAWNYPNHNYIPEGSVSLDAGVTWTSPFGIASATSQPAYNSNTGTYPLPFGGLQGLVATSDGTYADWMDCRYTSCTSPTTASWDFSAYAAALRTVALSSNVPSVNVTVTALGATTAYPVPGSAVFERNASVTAQVPSTLPDNASYVWGFSSWSGATSSSSNPTTFTYDGSGSTLTATYTPQPGAWISGRVGLEHGAMSPRPTVTISGLGTIPTTALNATTEQFNVTVTAGPSYTITVSAGIAYYTYTQTSSTSPHVAVPVDVVLARTQSYINGTVVVPTNANVTSASLSINGTPVAVNSAGGFTFRLEWGEYWVNASLPGYSAYSRLYNVTPGQALRLAGAQAVTLYGGTLVVQAQAPANMNVQVNGVPLTLVNALGTLGGLKSGLYTVTATARGYSYYSNGSVNVTPEHTTQVTISLTNKGWITGTINPANGSVEIAGTAVAVNPTTGAFNVSVTGGHSYLVVGLPNINDPSHAVRNYSVAVTPGNTTTLNVVLNKTAGSPSTGCPPTCPTTGSGNGGSNNTLLYIVIAVVIVAVAAVAVVLLLRRKPGAGSASAPAPEAAAPDTYDGTSPGELPKLQPDGSMGPGGPSE
jgi:hypothetical protein